MSKIIWNAGPVAIALLFSFLWFFFSPPKLPLQRSFVISDTTAVEGFAKLRIGNTKAEVTAILGPIIWESDYGKGVLLIWESSNSKIRIQFTGDYLVNGTLNRNNDDRPMFLRR